MRLLVLNVDRDDDLGRKTGIQAPVIGRDAVLKAATALAVADPEEADANGMFAAVKEYDEIAADLSAYGADAVFVAAATGHIREGTQADTAMAHQIDQIIAATNVDHCILVSDGGEDEHVMPIIQTRLKVDGVKRVIVKQAKNLEGALYLFNRLIHDEKLQRRFFMPLAVLFIALGVSILFNRPEIFFSVCLFLAAFYIFVQVFKWQEPIGGVFSKIRTQLQAGKLSFVMSLVALVVIIWGGYDTLQKISDYKAVPGHVVDSTTYSLLFAYFIYWRVVAAVLIVVAGRALDQFVREHHVKPRYWKAFAFILAVAVLVRPALHVARAHWIEGQAFMDVVTADLVTQLFFGGFLLFLGLIMQRYFQQVAAHRPGPPNVSAGK